MDSSRAARTRGSSASTAVRDHLTGAPAAMSAGHRRTSRWPPVPPPTRDAERPATSGCDDGDARPTRPLPREAAWRRHCPVLVADRSGAACLLSLERVRHRSDPSWQCPGPVPSRTASLPSGRHPPLRPQAGPLPVPPEYCASIGPQPRCRCSLFHLLHPGGSRSRSRTRPPTRYASAPARRAAAGWEGSGRIRTRSASANFQPADVHRSPRSCRYRRCRSRRPAGAGVA